ncbi:hypothetical protein X760_31060 [Mesorhizobium sp. LSHC422A00]|nr:hypothetical protein X760_31060 [Mesorhizobium sp. LSHC422A00]
MKNEAASFCHCHDGCFQRACVRGDDRDNRDNRDDLEWLLHYHNDADDR